MTTREKKINSLKSEIALFRSYFISQAGKDTEGDYKPALIRSVLRQLKSTPTNRFSSKEKFANLIGL